MNKIKYFDVNGNETTDAENARVCLADNILEKKPTIGQIKYEGEKTTKTNMYPTFKQICYTIGNESLRVYINECGEEHMKSVIFPKLNDIPLGFLEEYGNDEVYDLYYEENFVISIKHKRKGN